jgi:hypothetical protein
MGRVWRLFQAPCGTMQTSIHTHNLGANALQAESKALGAQISKLTTKVATVQAADTRREQERLQLQQEVESLQGLLKETRDKSRTLQHRTEAGRAEAEREAAALQEKVEGLKGQLQASTKEAAVFRAELVKVRPALWMWRHALFSAQDCGSVHGARFGLLGSRRMLGALRLSAHDAPTKLPPLPFLKFNSYYELGMRYMHAAGPNLRMDAHLSALVSGVTAEQSGPQFLH